MQIIIGIFLVSTVVFFWSLINLIAIVEKHGYRVNQWEIFVAILPTHIFSLELPGNFRIYIHNASFLS